MKAQNLFFTVLLLFVTTALPQETTDSSGSTACNGYPELCSKLYSDVAYPTTHNAFSVQKNNVARNQNYRIPTQLKDGIRAFMLDAHKNTSDPSIIELCHQDCRLLDAGPLVDTLTDMVTWLQENKNEVITIFWENFDKIDPSVFNAQYQSAGMLPYVYTPPSDTSAPWPTLQSMISSGKRVVNFIDSLASSSVPWLMNEYTYVFETVFEDNSTDAFVNNSTACTYDRPKGQSRPMYVLNHFLSVPFAVLGSITIDAPAPDKANISNADSLSQHVTTCGQVFGKHANFIAVDFYDQPPDGVNVLSVTAGINNVTYVPKQLGDGSLSGSNNADSSNNNGNVRSIGSIRLSQSFLQTIMALVVVAIFAIVGL